MIPTIENDRGSQFLMSALPEIDLQSARLLLDRASIEVSIDADVAGTAWGQSCALAIAACGTRMFRRGVFLAQAIDADTAVGNGLPRTLKRALLSVGCRSEPSPDHATQIRIGCGGKADVFASAEGWRATVGAKPETAAAGGNELSGIFAGASSVAVAFRKSVLRDPIADRRTLVYDLWQPGGSSPEDATLRRLPADLWLLGLGNLGQATLFTLGLLPYSDPAEVRLLLNDPDVCGLENLGVQLLSKQDWVGRKKATCSAEWAERIGFSTVISERRFLQFTKPDEAEPRVALVGVDNLQARRLAASAGFDLLIDAGLGATANEAFDVRLHAFPGARSPAEAWPEPEQVGEAGDPQADDTRKTRRNVEALVEAGVIDRCGAITIENQPVGVPCTALAAAAMQVAQLCRAIETGACCDMIDFDLVNSKRAFGRPMGNSLPPLVAVAARQG